MVRNCANAQYWTLKLVIWAALATEVGRRGCNDYRRCADALRCLGLDGREVGAKTRVNGLEFGQTIVEFRPGSEPDAGVAGREVKA